jgi:putative peptidoglycan lipid II flippase
VLTVPLAQVGLALATTIGAWINFGLVIFFASRRGLVGLDPRLTRSTLKLAAAGIVLAAALNDRERPLMARRGPAPKRG